MLTFLVLCSQVLDLILRRFQKIVPIVKILLKNAEVFYRYDAQTEDPISSLHPALLDTPRNPSDLPFRRALNVLALIRFRTRFLSLALNER
jgi:hypothetical protein